MMDFFRLVKLTNCLIPVSYIPFLLQRLIPIMSMYIIELSRDHFTHNNGHSAQQEIWPEPLEQ